jgi:hypothetical protein
MQLIQHAPRHSTGGLDPRRTLQVRQADRFEILAAASEVDDICPVWITDHLSERERVSS